LDAGASTLISSTLNNGGNAPVYQWQDSTDIHSWQDIPGANASTINYTPSSNGSAIRCRLTSNAPCTSVTTAISKALIFQLNYGGKIAPNPVGTTLNISGLKLSDHWVTLNIISVSTSTIMITKDISNQTSVSIPVLQLPSGMYVTELISSTGNRTELKFVKL